MAAKKSRSGTSRSYATRIAQGRPNKTYQLDAEIVAMIDALHARLGISKSLVVARAVRELAERQKESSPPGPFQTG